MITCALHMVQISAETSASSLGPFHLGGKNASAKAIFFFLGKRHSCAKCETIFVIAALFALTIGTSVENITEGGKKREKDLDIRTGE